MTPTDRKIDIMNKTYASVVQKLTSEIIDLKMKQDPEIDSDNIKIPVDYQLTIRADMADFRARKAEADTTFCVAICTLLSFVIVGLCVGWYLVASGVL